jgi:CheY-like chemotaxis protein
MRDVERLSSMASFGGHVAQRFLGPLAAIVGNAESLLKDSAGGPDRTISAVLERIRDEGNRAIVVADQLLTFAGQRPLHLEPVELSVLVKKTLESVEDAVPRRIALGVDLEPDLPTVLADVEHVRSILRNLLLQAAEAIGERAGQINVASGMADPRPGRRLPCGAESDPQGPCVYLELTDDASDKDASSRLQAFDRRSASRTPGADIALAAVLGAVRSQGGSVEVDFPARGGTAFRVLFPLHSEVPPGREGEQASGTILLFSQEQSTRSVTHKILERYGLSVLASSDMAEALELLRSKEAPVGALFFDADVGEPARDLGAELERLRLAIHSGSDAAGRDELGYPLLPKLPVILASSDPGDRETARGIGLEPAAFLQKPFTVELLMRTVRSVMKGGGQAPGASA